MTPVTTVTKTQTVSLADIPENAFAKRDTVETVKSVITKKKKTIPNPLKDLMGKLLEN